MLDITKPSRGLIVQLRSARDPILRLICFPYAGSGAGIFRPYIPLLPTDISIAALQLPGRENRIAEPVVKSYETLIQDLISSLTCTSTPPTVFWGHSLGGFIAFEIVARLAAQRRGTPVKLIVSACAPKNSNRSLDFTPLSDKELIEVLRELKGTPQEFLANQEAMALFLPLLRADFALAEEAQARISGVIDLPILVLGGTVDAGVSKEDLTQWQCHTRNQATIQMIEGDHFFINSNRNAVAAALISYLYHSQQ